MTPKDLYEKGYGQYTALGPNKEGKCYIEYRTGELTKLRDYCNCHPETCCCGPVFSPNYKTVIVEGAYSGQPLFMKFKKQGGVKVKDRDRNKLTAYKEGEYNGSL